VNRLCCVREFPLPHQEPSTFPKQVQAGPHPDAERELARLRRENEILRQERDLLKKATAFFAKGTSR
jgi:transposase-like protein